MTSIVHAYYAIAAAVWITLFITFINVSRSKVPGRVFFLFPIATALVTVPIYSVFISAKTYLVAMLFDGLYFICTDFLCFSMLLFILSYTWKLRAIKPAIFLFSPLLLVDSISLIMNTWKQHSFNLTRMLTEAETEYWACEFTSLHYIHLAFCYVMAAAGIIFLIHTIIDSPYGYKKKYIYLFIAFIVVICVNAICYSLDLEIDFSVFMYPLLAMFLYYYSLFTATRKLLTSSLTNVNENVDDAILYFDVNDDCFYTNSKAKKLFLNQDGIFSPLRASEFLIYTRGKNQAKNAPRPVEFFTIDGQERQFEVEAEDIYFGYNLIGSYLKLSDKTDEINRYLTQKFLANHDELTGAYSREYFFKVCDEKIKENPNTEFLMVSSNIRQFKLVNELFGEEVGNKLLIKMVTTAKTLAIHDCIIGRIGDDRFGLLAQKQYFTENLIKTFLEGTQQVLEGSVYKLNLCVGVCEVHDGESAQLLYDKTQLAINKICNDYQKHLAFYNSDLMDELLRERQITTEFEDALEAGQINMFLQPFFNADGNVIGCEALARWEHTQRGTLYPEVFIGPLERSGLIHKLDTFIWKKAASLLEEWEKRGIDDVQISVNVSEKDIYYIDIADAFKQLLLRHTFNPQNMKIEFTESALTKDINSTINLFSTLKQIGFEVGIDDFGQGYSSLNFLKDVNADILKMDMVLVKKNENQDRIKTILKFIVDISKAMNMKLIAEGVETAEQLMMLKNLGFSYFQGFFFAEPISISDFEKKYL